MFARRPQTGKKLSGRFLGSEQKNTNESILVPGAINLGICCHSPSLLRPTRQLEVIQSAVLRSIFRKHFDPEIQRHIRMEDLNALHNLTSMKKRAACHTTHRISFIFPQFRTFTITSPSLTKTLSFSPQYKIITIASYSCTALN